MFSFNRTTSARTWVRLFVKQQQQQQQHHQFRRLPSAPASIPTPTQLQIVSHYSTTPTNNSPTIITSASSNRIHRSSSPSSFQKRSMFIQTANTPNPESIKFIPGRPVLGERENETTTGYYVTKNEKTAIAKSPLCTKLFQNVDGIKAIYLGSDFITITKYAEYNWNHLNTPIFAAIMDFYTSSTDNIGPNGVPEVLLSQPVVTDTTILDTDDEIVAMIKELLETRIRPAVQEDGGDIHYVSYEEDTGLVYVKLAGSCVGCPSSSVTLKNGVENMLMHYIPEVSGVEAVEDEESEGDGSDLDGGVKVEMSEDAKKAKSYEDRLRAAGIPFSD